MQIHGRNAKEEIDVHHKLNHPNIITLINYYYEKDKNMTYMVLEFADNGSLHDKIKFGYGQLPKHKIKRYFRDVCKAVHYLHSLKYMHRDIKVLPLLFSPKIYSLPRTTIASSAILDSPPSSSTAAPSAAPTSTWPQK